jgi:hypothetical protein
MSTMYNLIAGQSVERLAALSDGLFAIAMTLLVLDLRVPASRGIHTELGLWVALVKLLPAFIPYFMSFVTLGIFWVGQQTQLNRFARSDRNLTWIHLGFLLAVSLMPFSTALLAEFITYRTALVVYWLNVLLLGVVLYGSCFGFLSAAFGVGSLLAALWLAWGNQQPCSWRLEECRAAMPKRNRYRSDVATPVRSGGPIATVPARPPCLRSCRASPACSGPTGPRARRGR